MTIEPIYSISFLIISIIITIFFVRRLEAKGCFSFGYIGLLILIINLFTVFTWYIMIDSVKDIYSVLTAGKEYTAKVISYTSERDDDGAMMNTPTVVFRTESGKVITKELEYSTTNLNIGDTYEVNYNEQNDEIITLGFSMIIMFVGILLFWFGFTFACAGILLFSFGFSLKKYFEILKQLMFYFFLPFIMIGFDALLIYALFEGNEIPLWATILVIFFVLVLTLAIYGYLKMLLTKGAPKMEQVSGTSWVANWD